MKYLSIYVHIPFCAKKCDYCDFTSFACKNNFDDYFNALFNEIKQESKLYKQRKVNTIFIGGGTPSVVDGKYIKKLMKTIISNFMLTKNCEITIECNPDSTTTEKLNIYKENGINRISFGVQTLNNAELELIGRVHNRNQAIQAIQSAQKTGFKNINADVMLGLPKQTKHSALNTVKKIVELGVNHISLYTLILEENTKLHRLVSTKQIVLPTENNTVKMFEICQNYLKEQKFTRYEVANFAKKNKQCKHNIGYWNNSDYVGFGLSAHSKIKNSRFANTNILSEYINNQNIRTVEYLTSQQLQEEKIMLGLRTTKGISLNLVKNKEIELQLLEKNKFINIKNNKITVTQKGFYVLNQIILMLV